jgi:hypothetical protein
MPPDGEVDAAGAAFTVTAGRRMTVVLEPPSASWTATAATEAPSPAEASNAATAMGVLILIRTFREKPGAGPSGPASVRLSTGMMPEDFEQIRRRI